MAKRAQVSLIITTYNWPSALKIVLESVALQQVTCSLEVIIADDGSEQETRRCIQKAQMRFPFPLYHVWHEDKGFRAASIRNRAIEKSSGDLIVFIDGDCVIPKDFIARHLTLAQRKWFVAGHRILLNKSLTEQVLTHQWQPATWPLRRWLGYYIQKKCNRWVALQPGCIDWPWRKWQPNRWKGCKTCNLSVWRDDLFAINGFDEQFQGWGFEDSDLVVRLLRSHVHCKDGRLGVPVIHLWHPPQDRQQMATNHSRFLAHLKAHNTWATQGITS